MNIILFTRRQGQVWSFEVNPARFALVILGCLTLIIGAVLYSGIRIGGDELNYVATWQEDVRQKQAEITAIRHTARKLQASGAALKVMIIISDGFPQDCDYGPERGEHEYGVQDTAKSLEEAERAGIHTFCITVDRSGHDYLRRMCPDDQYMVIEEIAELPDALQKAYRRLTQI